jgi:Amt family ammonium transporter
MRKLLGLPAASAGVLWLLATPSAQAADAPKVDAGDTGFMLVCSALVLFMTPGLAFFYGGMVRRKNVLATLTQSFVAMAVISVTWVLWGYSNAFGPTLWRGLIGGFHWAGLHSVSMETPYEGYGDTIPQALHMIYQCMFAIITPALITGAFAERKKFGAYLLFLVLWSSLVYNPLAHWVWANDGWLNKMGAMDFAGGTVVHISSGVSALVAALVLGKRRDYPSEDMRPHNLGLTILGTGMLWFGWFGFNAGSALRANDVAVNAFVNTNTATATAGLTWMFIEWAHRGRPTSLGLASGFVAGLVAITPACGFVAPLSSIVIGLGAGIFCYLFVAIKPRLGYDDTLDTFGVHGIGGTWGALATGCFALATFATANSPLNPDKHGTRVQQIGVQAVGVAATWVFAAVMTFILLKIVDALIGLRAKPADEDAGLDISQHGEEGYIL